MKFFEVFKTLSVGEELFALFESMEVLSVTQVKTGNYLRIRLRDGHPLSSISIRQMEEAIRSQVLQEMMSVRIEYENGYEYAEVGSGTYENPEDNRRVAQPKAALAQSSEAAPKSVAGTKKKWTSKSKKTDPGMIYGKDFQGEPMEISDCITEMRNVILRGTIFEKELSVTKNNFKILKLSITDRTDSISLKMFLREGEEKLPDAFKEGMTIEVCGNIEYDNFEGEILMTRVTGIREGKDADEARMDNAPKKRVELHLHTQYSDMDALTPVNDLLDKAVKWGHKAVAITDHGVVQGFTDAFHKLQAMSDPDFKVIYGVEAYIVDDMDDPIVQDPDSPEDIELRRESAIPDEIPKVIDPAEEERIEKVKKDKYYHAILLAKNETGRRNLYRLVSYSHINYFSRRPRIPKSVLNKYREGLILGSACVMGELYDGILSGESQERIAELVNYYDYLEIQPVANNMFLVRNYERNHDPIYRASHKENKGHMRKNADEIR